MKQVITTMWVTSLATFGLVALAIIPNEASINVPGEMKEVFAGVATILIIFLALASLCIYWIKKRAKQVLSGDVVIAFFVAFILFILLSKAFAVECIGVPPGGIREGWMGFPIPYHYCGVWGEDFMLWVGVIDVLILFLPSYMAIHWLRVREEKKTSAK